MRMDARWARAVTAVAIIGLLLPRPVWALQPTGTINVAVKNTADVQLDDAGTFWGQVIRADGQPLASVPIHITRHGKLVASVHTDSEGKFAVRQMRGGVYEVATPYQSDVIRLWAARTAPPTAAERLILTARSADIVRAQGDGQFMQFITNPWVLGGIVAAAIAIPLALDDDDQAS